MPWSELAKPMVMCAIVAIFACLMTVGAMAWYYRGTLRDMYSEGYRTAYAKYRETKLPPASIDDLTRQFKADYDYTHPEWVSDHTDLHGWSRDDLRAEIRKVMAA